MPLDQYVTLGRSGLRVSPLCLGAMTFGEDLGWGTSVEESQQIIDRYLELGGNFIDTANFYTRSHLRRSSAITSGGIRNGAIALSSPPSSAAISTRATPTAAGPAASR